MNGQLCRGCKFYLDAGDPGSLPHTDEPWGYCRRYPPVLNALDVPPTMVRSDDGCWVLPIILGTDWCGEWQPLPMKPPVSGK